MEACWRFHHPRAIRRSAQPAAKVVLACQPCLVSTTIVVVVLLLLLLGLQMAVVAEVALPGVVQLAASSGASVCRPHAGQGSAVDRLGRREHLMTWPARSPMRWW